MNWDFTTRHTTGGYEVDFAAINYTNVTRPVTFKKGFGGDIATSGILNDLDGTLGSGASGGTLVPYAGHFEANPNCKIGVDLFDEDYGDKEYVMCKTSVRRVSLAATMTSAYVNTRSLFQFPHGAF